MQKLFCLVLLTFGINTFSFAQKFDGYKYVVVGTIIHGSGATDIFGVSYSLRNNFERKGFIILSEDNSLWPTEAKQNPCQILFCSPTTRGNSTVGFIVRNCKQEIVFDETKTSVNWVNDVQQNYTRALKSCWASLDKYSYHFNSAATPQQDLPVVEQTDQTEETIKKYLLANQLDPIEGIYKPYQTGELSYYKVGIIKDGNQFKAIVLESDLPQWKRGQVKAVFEQSSVKGIYSVKWFLANKTPYETFSSMSNPALLNIHLINAKTGAEDNQGFIKMFPGVDEVGSSKPANSKASGTGFFLTTNGILATNAHVIKDAANIEVIVFNESGSSSYKSKVLLSDSRNDVALLQIDDPKFKELSAIPYGIVENANLGSRVFTIGYPLNDIMGKNIKASDGIISSTSGIEDDIRYYQITVPLQPGNSGGPLFDKDGNVIGITSGRLNSEAVGSQVENVNYAIKSSYLLTLYNMLPNVLKIPQGSMVPTTVLQDQIKTIKNYVCLIKIY